MCRQPILIYAADRSGLRRAYERAMARNVEQLAIFTHDLFSTPHDQANRAAIADVPAADLDLAGIALHANRRTVDKILDKLRPTPSHQAGPELSPVAIATKSPSRCRWSNTSRPRVRDSRTHPPVAQPARRGVTVRQAISSVLSSFSYRSSCGC
jgi:hypothetical protein